jgi:hypothetical protein
MAQFDRQKHTQLLGLSQRIRQCARDLELALGVGKDDPSYAVQIAILREIASSILAESEIAPQCRLERKSGAAGRRSG